ncbi:hypothetical protein Csa_011040 [Cucumis sativus]|uniref:Uncharacterized protein n=1 Tax=Cucumis sativus TaxID=3659 RepID=A0A0A0LB86_CUCSA|nr:hypothetical protein Csa_011040 [Cucumis sativus]
MITKFDKNGPLKGLQCEVEVGLMSLRRQYDVIVTSTTKERHNLASRLRLIYMRLTSIGTWSIPVHGSSWLG